MPRSFVANAHRRIRSVSRLIILASGDARVTYELGQKIRLDAFFCDWKDKEAFLFSIKARKFGIPLSSSLMLMPALDLCKISKISTFVLVLMFRSLGLL